MENQIQIFNNDQFGELTTVVTDEGKTLFKANDVAKALGYVKPANAVTKYCRWVTNLMTHDALGREQPTKFIPESDLYRLVMRSKLPEAEKFQDWVVEDILPTIRKHGAYLTEQVIEQALLNPDTVIQLATSLKEEREARLALQVKNAEQLAVIAQQDAKIQDMTAKSTYCEQVLASSELVEITLIAQDYGTTATIMNRFLHTAGIQFRQGNTWVLYEKYKYKGYTQSKTFPITHTDGHITTKVLTLWTQKGRLFLYEFLKDNFGALPIVERDENYVQPYGLMSSTAKKKYKRQ